MDVDANPPGRGSAEQRGQSARGMLAAYQERRRRRRAEDTFFGAGDALLSLADESQRRERRDEIRDDARRVGMPLELAERLHEVALEEGLDPGLAFDLVRSGLGVAPPEGGVSNAPDAPTTDPYLPEWFFPALPPDDLLRERMLRVSFRRLRALLEQHDDLEDAFRAFVDEPDVGYYGY